MNLHKRTQIFAHRGANKEAAENTRSAFDRALLYPIDGMETDVQLSRDEVPVLWHDRFLGKLGMPMKRIDDFDYARLQEMNFAAHFSKGAQPEGIMSLQAFLDAYRQRCRLLIEIKNRSWESRVRHEAKVRQTLDLIGPGNLIGAREMAGAAGDDRILVSSFNLDSLIFAHQCAPKCPLVYNFEPEQTRDEAQRVIEEQSFLHGLCLPIESLNDSIVKLLRNHDKRIAVYTCNSEEEIGKALDLDVDILISDVPQKALQMKGQACNGVSRG